MLSQEIEAIRKYIKAMQDPDGSGELRINADNTELLNMKLYDIRLRVEALESTIIPHPAREVVETGGNVVNFKGYKKTNTGRKQQ